MHARIKTYVSIHAFPSWPVVNEASFRELNHFMPQLCVTCLIQISIYPRMREEQPHWTWRDLSSSQTLFIWWIHLLERFERFRMVASNSIIIITGCWLSIVFYHMFFAVILFARICVCARIYDYKGCRWFHGGCGSVCLLFSESGEIWPASGPHAPETGSHC